MKTTIIFLLLTFGIFIISNNCNAAASQMDSSWTVIPILAIEKSSSTAKLVSLESIWTYKDSGKPHNAFTDMIRFKDEWYVGCREAIKHHGGLDSMGQLKVLRSKDGTNWKTAGHFVVNEGVLRNARRPITGNGELMLNSAIQVYYPDPLRGDSSYPGLVYYNNLLWVSYYSSIDNASEEGRYLVPTAFRLAKVKLQLTTQS